MRLEPGEPSNESDYWKLVRELTFGSIFWERVESSNESGFPDTHFCLRDGGGEGTIELKYERKKKLALHTLLRGNQKASLLDYHEAGGRRRWALCYGAGYSHLYDTTSYCVAVLRKTIGTEGSVLLTHDETFAQKLTDLLRW